MLERLVSKEFQVLFHHPHGVLFTFPSRYYSTIGRQKVFSLGWWSTLLPTRFLVTRGTQVYTHTEIANLSCTGLSPPMVALSRSIPLDCNFVTPKGITYNPCSKPQVWANPRSLAAT